MDIERPEALPSDYYVANFHALATFINDTYFDILSEAECEWYSRLSKVSVAALSLYIRLLTRKGPVFRLSRLNYVEIPDYFSAAKELQSHELACIAPPTDLSTLVAAYTKPELLSLLDLKNSRSQPRADLLEDILCSDDEKLQVYTEILQQSDGWIVLNGHKHWNIYRLCFFGNLYQDSTEFVLRDIGTVVYEDYDIDKNSRAFQTRREVDGHMRYFECVTLLDTIDQSKPAELMQLLSLMPENIPGDSRLLRRLDRFRNRIARQLERLNEPGMALTLYSLSQHPPARERRVRIYLAMQDLDKAEADCLSMLSDPMGDAEAQVARRLQGQIHKARGGSNPTAKRYKPVTENLLLHNRDERVEVLAQQHFSEHSSCFYTENTLVAGVLGLFIWDILFLPLPGVFYNPFQSAPADYYDADFEEKRSTQIVDRFSELNDRDVFSKRVLSAFHSHYPKSNPLVRWRSMSEDMLSLALQRIPVNHWRAMFTRMLENLRENTSGFPDLVLFDSESGYEFVEIKGPGDVLQQNQRRWMKYFSEHGIPCRVVNVSWLTQTDLETPQSS